MIPTRALPPVHTRPGWRVAGVVIGVVLTGARAAAAQALPDLPAPFAAAAPARIDHDAAWAETLAQRALHAGMYHLAEGLFRDALARADLSAVARRPLDLGLVSALLAQAKREEALAALEAMPGEHDGAWELRRAAVDFLARDFVTLASRVAGIDPDRLPPGDVAWVHFLRAMVAEAAHERTQADDKFRDAIVASPSAAATAWFSLAQFQMRLNADEATEALLQQISKTRDDYEGQPLGFEATLLYAATQERLGRKPEAVDALMRQRRQLPAGATEWRDKTLLLLGLIAGVESPDGYAALRDLLEHGANPEWQRIALQRLMAAASAPGSRARGELTRLLDALLIQPAQHPLTEDLLYYRAALALQEQKFEDAEADANAVRTRFPGSALRPGALALLASSSWQRTRYRSAADYVAQLRADETTDPRERARLALLVGECYFRAGEEAGTAEDYRNAADAFGRAQDDLAQLADAIGPLEAERVAGATMGAIFFQRVLAAIRGGNMDGAAALLSDPKVETIDAESRWQAAWNYVRYLQLNGRSPEAFRQLEAWGAAENAPPELRLKFLWLLAQLTLETGRPAETPARVAAVRAFLSGPSGGRVDAATRAQVESNAALLDAQGQLDRGETEAGLRAMDQLRRDFPNSNAAIFSYIIQARYLSAAGQLVEAQKLLISLAETHPKSEYAPRALYEAAEQAQKRGQDAQFIEARELLEKLATSYPQDRYEFFARLEQGDILRKLNQFAAAEQVYSSLENRYPNHQDRDIAQLSLAVTLMAQVDNDPAKFDAAIARLERLTDRPTAEADLRVEAGFRLGYGWQSHGDLDRAAEIYWDLYQRFLGEPRPGQTRPALGARGTYWLARALLELGEIDFKAGRRENARRSFQAILDHGLPGEALANGWLAQLRAGG